MGAAAREGVEIEREAGHEGFALAGAELSDAAIVGDDASDELDIVVALAYGAARGLADDGECLWENLVEHVVEGFARFIFALGFVYALFFEGVHFGGPVGLDVGAELVGFGPELEVGELLGLWFQGVYFVDGEAVFLDIALVGVEESAKKI